MIHRVEITPELSVAELKKVFRKRLMTGGAVVRLAESVQPEHYSELIARFGDGAVENGVQSLVLVELAECDALSEEQQLALAKLGLKNVSRSLSEREHVSTAVRTAVEETL